MEWMHGGGRDPNGRGLDDEIRIGKEDWMERQRVANSNPLGFPGHMIHEYEGGQLSPEEFYQHQSIPQSERPLTGAQGGRVGFKDAGRALTGEKFTEIAEKYPDYTNQELLDYFKKHKFTNRYGEPLNLSAIKTQKSKIFDLAAETKAKLPKNYAISTEVFENLPISKEDYFRVRLETKGGTLLTKEIDEILKPVKIGDTFYFKNPSKRDLKNFNRLADKTGRLNSKTADLMIKFDAKYGEKFFSKGEVPLLEDVINDIKYKGKKITPSTAGKVTTRLAQWYGGQDFKNPQLEDLKRNKVTSNRMFKVIEKSPFGNPYREGLYQIAMQTIDAKLGNKQGTFDSFKTQAKNILKENKIPIYNPRQGKAAFGFNVNELAGVTGSAKSKAAEFSQFVDIMEGNLNTKTLAAFQSKLSVARAKIEAAKGTKNYKDVLSKQSKIVNEWAQRLEKTHEIKLPRLRDPDAAKYFSTKRIRELEMQGLDIVKAAERAGYTIEMPKGAATIKEFVENPKTQIKLLKRMGYGKNCKASGGRVGFAEAGAVTGEMQCIMGDVEKTRADMKSPNVEVRAKALTKQRGALKIASKIPQIGKILKTGIQAGTAAITAPLKWLGLTSGIGYAIEGIVEGGFYDNARRKGYTHEQAFAETFSPRLIKEGVEGKSTEDVPWYGGAETLLEQELIGDPKQNPKVAQYVDALKEQDRIYDLIRKKEVLKDQPTTTDETLFIPGDLAAASTDVHDLARSGAYRRVDQTLKPESMAAQAYETAVERQKGRQDQRRREYLEKYDPGALKYEERTLSTPRQLEKRYEAMEEKYPTYTREQLEDVLEAWGMNTPWDAGFTSGVKGYDEMGEWLKTHDKYKTMEAGVANIAEGGIASLKK